MCLDRLEKVQWYLRGEPVPDRRASVGVPVVTLQTVRLVAAHIRLGRLLQLTTARAVYQRAMGLQLKGSGSEMHGYLPRSSGRASVGEAGRAGLESRGGLLVRQQKWHWNRYAIAAVLCCPQPGLTAARPTAAGRINVDKSEERHQRVPWSLAPGS